MNKCFTAQRARMKQFVALCGSLREEHEHTVTLFAANNKLANLIAGRRHILIWVLLVGSIIPPQTCGPDHQMRELVRKTMPAASVIHDAPEIPTRSSNPQLILRSGKSTELCNSIAYTLRSRFRKR